MRNEITVGYEGIFRGEETKIPRINLEDAKLIFNARKAGPANFNDLRNGSYGEGFRMATMPELIHLIKNKDERIFEPMSEYGLSGNNIIIPIKTGIYIVDNPLKDQMDLNYLKCQLGDHEEGGVIFSRDKKIRFVQKGYTLGVQSLQDLIKNPVTIALAKGEKNASQLESIPDILKKENPRNVICVGKTVEKVLNGKLNKMFGHNLTVMPQPNARLKSEKRLEVLQSYFGLCNQ